MEEYQMKRTLIVGAMTCLLGLAVVTPTSAAQRGQATMTWLGISASARDEAMGGTASAGDASALCAFTNPAGLGRVERGSVFFNTTSWLADMSVTDAAVAYRVPSIGTFSLALRSMDYGDFTFTTLFANEDGYIYTPSDSSGDVAGMMIGVGYGRKLTDKFSIGAQLKYVSDKLGKMNILDKALNRVNYGEAADQSAYLFDFGTSYHTGWKSVTINMTIQNFGRSQKASNGVEEFTPPLTFKVGLEADALQFVGMEIPMADLKVRFEGADPRDDRLGFNTGAELVLKPMDMVNVAVRGGYSRRDQGGLTFGAGVGTNIGGFNTKLDWGYSDWGGVLGAVNRMGVSFAF
jgi:hypothetical protein